MENTSYALYIAAGTVIAIMILSLIVLRWRQISNLESVKDDLTLTENMAEFNAEYEAYNRTLMYGTDVLSCLNKAQNNNQKYVYNNYYGTQTETIGKDNREEHFIDVEVSIKSPLVESVKAYYRDSAGRYQRAIGLGSDRDTKNNYNDKIFEQTGNNHFDDPLIYYYYFENGNVYKAQKNYSEAMWGAKASTNRGKTLYEILGTGQIETSFIADKPYHLLKSNELSENYYDVDYKSSIHDKNESAQLSALITTVSLKEQRVVNSSQPTNFSKEDWWYCTWTTAASDFKTRKFKCTGTTYNENTGYIVRITFQEV